MNPYEIGDILVSSWGYDQTNVNYFQVVRKTASSIWIKPISASVTEEGWCCGHCTPVKDSFIEKSYLNIPDEGKMCRVKDDGWVTVKKGVIHAHRWDGQPNYVSWYA